MTDILPDTLDQLSDLVSRALKAGADEADALLVDSTSLSASCRLGAPEHVERAEESDIGLRVIVGKRQACVSSTDREPEALEALVERTLAMARAVPEDPFCGLATPAQITTEVSDLDLADRVEPSPEQLAARALEAEEAARAIAGVTNSEGGSASWGRATVAMAASNGFRGGFTRTQQSVSAAVLAGAGTAMERDYEFTAAVYGEDLMPAAEVGRRAGERAIRRLGARKAKTARVPVVFDRRVANSLLGHLASAINGRDVARGTSFLKDRMGEEIFAPGLTVIDDPHRRRGLKSKPFDVEGLGGARHQVIQNGRLTTWILDLRTARQLGLSSTGHASRSTGGPPSPASSNLYLEPGTQSVADLIGDIETGFLVTEMMGFGVNPITGDYSRGASGFWIEKGEIAYPVSEVTVAGNLKEMFRHITPADDLVFQFGTNAPTLRVDGMTVAGS